MNSGPPAGVVAICANYNTKHLIARWSWSIYRFARAPDVSILVVDNGSSDGSLEFLRKVAAAGLCDVISNEQNRQHGPALSQAISHLARAHPPSGDRPWLWLLDSDCVIARADTVVNMINAATEAQAALLGEAHWDHWNKQQRFFGFSLLIDPARAWRAEVGAIQDGGDPIGEFEQACRSQGVPAASFPFAAAGYLIHLGRGTLAGVLERREELHPHFEWARDHHEPHFQEITGAPARYAKLVEEFNEVVPNLEAEQLIQACLRS